MSPGDWAYFKDGTGQWVACPVPDIPEDEASVMYAHDAVRDDIERLEARASRIREAMKPDDYLVAIRYDHHARVRPYNVVHLPATPEDVEDDHERALAINESLDALQELKRRFSGT